ncbi:competence protein ComEC [Chitinophaga sp. CF118]|uniref:ComEC/Rec2 family competence protein n=1 Tax=Chitinophaga sp. CF118 TaxID=1884367 RepID=UPI0008F023A2|nr:ComEC/Rec2 family competence protein [Chitinophaga sp. CF118]SFE72621.1 competence protein ComEC [Chitinophaga sp. CF118]
MFVAFLKRAPFVRLIFPLAIGIVLQPYLPLFPGIIWAGCGLLLLLLFLLSRLSVWIRYVYGWTMGVILHLLIICAGYLLTYYSDVRHNQYYYGHVLRSTDFLLVIVKEPLQEKARSYRTTVQVTAIVRRDSMLPVKGSLLLYLQKDTAVTALQCGDRLLLCNKLNAVSNSGNPGAFDYRRYCAAHQIYQQAYLQTGEWQLNKRNKGDILLSARNYCLRILNQYIGGKEAGLAAALLIGYRYDLDKEMVQDYTNTGIVHIIAISGMHLALIYGSLLWLLQWWPAHRFTNMLKALLIIFLLWAFTLLTGASASVLRASVMFTFITVGKFVLDRYTNVYNTLAASAFLLLCYDPGLLTDAGFQLSYLAVLSILICFKPLYSLLYLRNRWLDKIWEAIALTLAAQLLTLPVCLYYFHQFPLYFLPANLLAVPLSTIILYGEILLLMLGKFNIPAHYMGTCLQWLMVWMNKGIAEIGHLPGALIREIYITLYGTICCYIMVAGILVWWLCRWTRGLITALWSCLIWAVWNMADSLQAHQQHQLVVYNIPAHTAVDVIDGRSVRFFGDAFLDLYLQPSRASFKILRSCRTPSHYLTVGNKRLLVIDGALQVAATGKKIRIDYLLLSHNPHVDIKQLDALFDAGLIIFDASNKRKSIEQWKSDCYALTLRFFSVPDQGAYVVKF